MNRSRTCAVVVALILGALPSSVASQQRPPPPTEEEVIATLTESSGWDWGLAAAASMAVPSEEISPRLLEAMITGLERATRLENEYLKRNLAEDLRPPGETLGHLAQKLAGLDDPAVLPVIAWYAYNGGQVPRRLVLAGHEAVPHLLAVVTSPDASGGYIKDPLLVLAGIVVREGPGPYEDELVEAALLHLNGPPEHFMSSWKNSWSDPLLQAIALAGVLKAPVLTARLEELAEMPVEEVAEMVGRGFMADVVAPCARALLDGTRPSVTCNPYRWAGVQPRR